MIALIDDLDQQKVNKNSNKSKTIFERLRQALAKCCAKQQKRRAEKIALHQLMQLDDALLKDMGLSRYELVSIRDGHLTFDSLIKHTILSNRDHACSTTSLRK